MAKAVMHNFFVRLVDTGDIGTATRLRAVRGAEGGSRRTMMKNRESESGLIERLGQDVFKLMCWAT